MAEEKLESHIESVRSFNRYYTKLFGLLRPKLLDSDFSLPEARVFYELGRQKEVKSLELIELLDIDAGYLSRILARFERAGLVIKKRSQNDGRERIVKITPSGEKAWRELDVQSASQTRTFLKRLTSDAQTDLVSAMDTIHHILDINPSGDSNLIFRSQRPGDIGYLIHRHGAIYSREYGFNEHFESYVAAGLASFIDNYNSDREKLWIVERYGKTIGSIAIVAKSKRVAQLRWLFVEPEARGSGLGRRLVEEAVSFARERGYHQVVLWSVRCLHKARKIYKKQGFELLEERKNQSWGSDVTEEYWSKKL